MSSGYRALAAAVLLRAIKDAHGSMDMPTTAPQRRAYHASAKAFLRADNPDLALYCDAVDLDPVALCEAINGLHAEAPSAAPRSYVGIGEG